MQSGAFEAYDNRKIEVNLRQPVSIFFFMEKCTIHENPSWKQQCTLVYMRSVTMIPRFFIYKYHLKMSHKKSFNEFIYNTH